jgi:hypothetical protein
MIGSLLSMATLNEEADYIAVVTARPKVLEIVLNICGGAEITA